MKESSSLDYFSRRLILNSFAALQLGALPLFQWSLFRARLARR